MTPRLITVWTEFIRGIFASFSLKFLPTTHRLENPLAVTADKQLILPSARFVLMGSVIHAIRRMLTKHISSQSSIIALKGNEQQFGEKT